MSKQNTIRMLFAWVMLLLLTITQVTCAFATNATATPEPIPSATPIAGPTTPPPTPTPAPTVNPAYTGLALKNGDQNPTVELVQQRLRDLGYYNYKVTDYYGNVTELSVKDFQEDNKLTADGVFGGQTAALLFSNNVARSLGNNRIPTPTPSPTPKKPVVPQYGALVSWTKAKTFVAWGNGPKFKAKDVKTGAVYWLIRVGGYNHMDVEPATKTDTAILKRCYGGKWSYDRRATIVQFGGKWYAASINGFPHGKETVSNNDMKGQICLHFQGSRTHGTNIVDSSHQRNILKAAGK